MALGQKMVQNQQAAGNLADMMGGPFGLGQGYMMPLTVPIPVGQLMMQAQQAAASSREQLLEDVAALDRYNEDVNGKNDRASEALRAALLETHGPKRKDWIKWWTELIETSTTPIPRPREPAKKDDPAPKVVSKRAMLPGFRQGHRSGRSRVFNLWNRSGRVTWCSPTIQRPVGGATSRFLRFAMAMRQPIKKLTIGGKPVETTAMERLWVAGKGWAMAGDLKPGESIRSLSGLRRLTEVEDAGFEPVYHVQLGEGPGIAVGEFGILAHDEGVVRPVVAPFDSTAITEGSLSPR